MCSAGMRLWQTSLLKHRASSSCLTSIFLLPAKICS